MIVTTDAIVLHSRRYGDTSRIVVLYTKDLGKVSVVARGARKPRSPFGASLEPLSHTSTTIYHKPNRGLHTISAAEQITPRHALKDSYDHLTTGLSLCQLVMRTQADEVPAEEVYSLLQGALLALDDSSSEHCYGISLDMRLHLADRMGFGLPLAVVPNTAALKLNIEDGIPRADSSVGIRMTTAAYKHINSAQQSKVLYETRTIPAADQIELEAFLSLFFSHHLDKRI